MADADLDRHHSGTHHRSGVTANGPFEVAGRGTGVVLRHEGELKLPLEHLSR